MALTHKSAVGVLTGIAGLVMTVSNPNFEAKDIVEPTAVLRKAENESGMWYAAGYAAMMGAAVGLSYNALTGKLRK
ncbi:hypothetical protein HY642_02740 [Candidatus Woesearchaeota archaeon]|nr:hypothetical protein [Candidatus Woesearchaeota archaeon]